MSDPVVPAIDDATLRAYLTGSLSADQAAQIDAALLVDADLTDRMVALDPAGPLLREAADAVLTLAPQARMAHRLTQAPDPWRRSKAVTAAFRGGAMAASFAAGLALAVWLPLGRPSVKAAGWVEAASGMVRLFSAETFAASVDPAALQAAIADMSARTGADLTPFGAASPGFRLVRADLLAFEDKPLVQLVYLSPDDQIVALCILVRPPAAAAKADPSRKIAPVGDLSTVVWDRANLGLLVLGRDGGAVNAFAASL